MIEIVIIARSWQDFLLRRSYGFPSEVGASITRDCRRHIPSEKHILLQFLYHCEDIGIAAGEAFNPLGKHIYNSKNILVTHTK